MPLNPITRRVLESVVLRARALMQHYRVRTSGSRIATASEADTTVELVELATNPEPLSAEDVLTFGEGAAFAETLASDVWELLWSEFTEELIAGDRVRLDGIGSFEVHEDRGEVFVTFTASEEMLKLQPLVTVAETGQFGAVILAMAELFEDHEADLEADIFSHATYELPSIVISYVSTMLRPVVSRVINQTPDRLAANIASEGAAAFIGFSGTVWAMAHILRHDGNVRIPLIGTFKEENDGIDFIPAADLLELLAANHPITA
jgi:nucleoid DNA-binding protein